MLEVLAVLSVTGRVVFVVLLGCAVVCLVGLGLGAATRAIDRATRV